MQEVPKSAPAKCLRGVLSLCLSSDVGLHHSLSDKCRCAQTVCVNNVVFMLHTCFPSEGRGFGYVVGKGCLGDRPPIKTLGTEGTVSFPGRQHIARVVTIHCWEIKRVCVAPWGEALGSVHLVSPVFAP